MSDSKPNPNWDSLADLLGAETPPQPAEPAVSSRPPVSEPIVARPALPKVEVPRGEPGWDSLAENLGLSPSAPKEATPPAETSPPSAAAARPTPSVSRSEERPSRPRPQQPSAWDAPGSFSGDTEPTPAASREEGFGLFADPWREAEPAWSDDAEASPRGDAGPDSFRREPAGDDDRGPRRRRRGRRRRGGRDREDRPHRSDTDRPADRVEAEFDDELLDEPFGEDNFDRLDAERESARGPDSGSRGRRDRDSGREAGRDSGREAGREASREGGGRGSRRRSRPRTEQPPAGQGHRRYADDAGLREVDPRDIDPRDIDPRDLDPREMDSLDLDARSLEEEDIDPRDIDPREVYGDEGDDRGAGRRRRRRRGRRGEGQRSEGRRGEGQRGEGHRDTLDRSAESRRARDDEDELDSDSDDLLASDELDEPSQRRGADRPRRRAGDDDVDAFEDHGYDEDDDVSEAERRAHHRSIPSWKDTIGLIIDANLEARARFPQGSSGAPRGNGSRRGGQRRGGRGRGSR